MTKLNKKNWDFLEGKKIDKKEWEEIIEKEEKMFIGVFIGVPIFVLIIWGGNFLYSP